ncbi:MAG: hypothetical protein WCD13_02705, partial [Pseudolabrys sp.]
SGTTTSALRTARRNPIAKYMDDSIMNTAFKHLTPAQAHATAGAQSLTSTGRPVSASQPPCSEVDGIYK